MLVVLFCLLLYIFFFKQKTAYVLRISDWSSDVFSSDLVSMLAMACTSMAAAQGTDTEATPAVAQSNADEAEIVVTANKREQRLNDVGLAVAVVGGDALKNQQISSLADIAQSVQIGRA